MRALTNLKHAVIHLGQLSSAMPDTETPAAACLAMRQQYRKTRTERVVTAVLVSMSLISCSYSMQCALSHKEVQHRSEGALLLMLQS